MQKAYQVRANLVVFYSAHFPDVFCSLCFNPTLDLIDCLLNMNKLWGINCMLVNWIIRLFLQDLPEFKRLYLLQK